MLTYLRRISSLKNLYCNQHKCICLICDNLRQKKSAAICVKGQVATLLMLIMVGVLIFILVTVNLGQISLTTTNLANVSDTASLNLASQLSSKANQLWESLGRTTEKCKKGGMLGTILSIITAIVLSITGYGLLTVMLASAVAGGTGNAIVYGTPQAAILGAIQGAGIAAAIYGGAYTFGGGETVPVGAVGTSIGAITTFVSVPGAIAGGALATGSALYNAYVADQMTQAAFSALAKGLSGLPEYDRYREATFLQALSQTIDDPNKVVDDNDSDGDGDSTEKVPYFQYWWDKRTSQLKSVVPQLKSLTEDFINGPLTDFENSSQAHFTQSCTTEPEGNQICQPGALSRQEVEGADGAVVEVARALENAGYNISFYRPGTPPPYDPACDTCGPEDYYDEVDAVVSEFKRFGEIVQDLIEQDIDQLTSTWQSWIGWFYDTEGTDDYYDTLNVMIEGDGGTFRGLSAWQSELEDKRRQLPECDYYNYGDGITTIMNPPCKDGSFGSIDSDLDDEFSLAQTEISDLITEIGDFRTDSQNYYNDMQAAYASMSTDYGGINPVTYEWTDSRGSHSVIAEAGPFKIARVVTKKSGGFLKKKICLQLVDYSDDGSNCWIKITRKDPTDKEIKSGSVALGKWNPSPFRGEISRISRASYSYDNVGISGRD